MRFPLTLSTDAGGSPSRWVDYKEVALYKSKGMILWSYGEYSYEIFGGYQSGEISKVEIPSIIGIDKPPDEKIGYRTPLLKRSTLFRRDFHICGYCGRNFSDKGLTIDHIYPRSKGGPHSWMNTIACCLKCNRIKGPRTPEEADMQLLFLPYVPDKAEYLILMNKRILNDQMDFLKNMINNKDSRYWKYKQEVD